MFLIEDTNGFGLIFMQVRDDASKSKNTNKKKQRTHSLQCPRAPKAS